MPSEEQIDEVRDQLLYGEACAKFAIKLFDALGEKRTQVRGKHGETEYINDPGVIQLQSIANFYADRAILELDSLLSKRSDVRSIESILTKNDETLGGLAILREHYEQSGLSSVRSKYIAHVDIKTEGHPALGRIFSTYRTEILNNIIKSYDMVKEYWAKLVGLAFGNNYYLDKLDRSLGPLLDILPRISDFLDNNSKQVR